MLKKYTIDCTIGVVAGAHIPDAILLHARHSLEDHLRNATNEWHEANKAGLSNIEHTVFYSDIYTARHWVFQLDDLVARTDSERAILANRI